MSAAALEAELSSPAFALGVANGSINLLELLTPIVAAAHNYSNASVGTGILELTNFGKQTGTLTSEVLFALIPELPGLFGGYPADNSAERGPDGLWIALFGIACMFFFGRWIFNTVMKHNFHLYLFLAFYCLMKVVGFACRIAWSFDVSKVKVGLAATAFIQVAPLILMTINTVLAHRLFIWRHPEIGHHWIFVQFLNSVYLIVIIIIVMAIVGQSLPYLYFFTGYKYTVCKNLMKAAAILNLYYGSMSLQMIIAAFAVKPGTLFTRFNKNKAPELPPIYQAYWIENSHPLAYPPRHEEKVYFGKDAVRIIPSREVPGYGHKRLGGENIPTAPRVQWAIATVIFSSLMLVFCCCFRVAACFKNEAWGALVNGAWKVTHWQQHAYVQTIFFGGGEFLVVLAYLVARIDLRFYIPDRPKKENMEYAADADVYNQEKESVEYVENA